MSVLAVSEEVRTALAEGKPVVALETTIVAHGFPEGEGLEVGRECEARVRAAGAVPATTAVLDGALRVGLSASELERIGPGARKVGPRDVGACVVRGAVGATTVGGTLTACRATGIHFMATGGLGGVHRGWTERPDVSADVPMLGSTPVLVACSGVKSLLDVRATAELLETLGVPVLGWQTDELPLFYAARGGPPVSQRIEDAAGAAAIARAHWELSSSSLVLARPPVEGLDDVEPLIEAALGEAAARGVSGQAVTPFVLAFLHERSGGRTLAVNRRLAADNAGLAGQVSAAFSSSG
ncbi:MAG TPA: pseudouridine-5'-phosphate glycosidase [Gaiellaceae bacterium]|nr:pseudouridine-5'-phosphate glycosidase [Gaiellaceae bacterium]